MTTLRARCDKLLENMSMDKSATLLTDVKAIASKLGVDYTGQWADASTLTYQWRHLAEHVVPRVARRPRSRLAVSRCASRAGT